MGAVSYSSVVVTLFTYVQRLGLSANLPSVKIPSALKDVLVICVNFYNTIEAAIPDLPDLDFRSQLVCLAVGIPIVLDLIFVWFIFPFYDVVMHMLDIFAIGAFTYFITTGITIGFDSVTTTWSVVAAIYIVSRLVIMFYNKNRTIDQLFDLVQNVCNFFMGNIIPESPQDVTFKELNSQIHKFSKLIEIVPEKAVYWKSLIWLFFAIGFIFAGFGCLGMFSDPGKIPDIVRVVLPIFFLPFGFLFWIIFMLQMFACGRKFIVLSKQFIKRWGLRVLLLALDILYIPIIQCLVYHMTPAHIGCDPSFYLYYERKGKELLSPFVNKTVECLPCAKKVTGVCVAMCSGQQEFRMKSSPGLLFGNDVWAIMGGVICYTFFVIMIGIPAIWFFLVKRNAGFVKHINVYGATSDRKWEALANRLHTTGIFIFQDFKHNRVYWCVFLIVMKLIAMLIEVLSEIVWEPFMIAQPIYFLVSMIITWVFKPYIHYFNNLFETLLEGVNLVFSILAILSYYSIEIPDKFTLPLSVLLLGIPIVSLFFILCIDEERGTADDETDPTFLRKPQTKTVKELDMPNISDNTAKDDMEQLLLQPEQDFNDLNTNPLGTAKDFNQNSPPTSSRSHKSPRAQNDDKDDNQWEYANCDDEHCIIEEGLLDTIEESLEREQNQKISPEETQPLIAFEVRKTKIAKLMTKMYETLDVVLDGSTIELLTRMLDYICLIGAAATGWYLGALLANHQKATEIICG